MVSRERLLLPGMAQMAGGGSFLFSASSSLTAISLALRLVFARGWAGSAPASASAPTSTGAFVASAQHVGTSCWMNPGGSCTSSGHGRLGATRTQRGGKPDCRRPFRLWLFDSIATNSAGTRGAHTGQCSRHYRDDQQHRAHSTWRGESFVETKVGTKPTCRAFGNTALNATKSDTIAAAGVAPGDTSLAAPGSPTSAADGGDAAAAAATGAASSGGDDDNPDSPVPPASTVASTAASMRSLRTARDRGDVKYKKKKRVKPVKSKPPSDFAEGGGNSIAAPRSGPKLLRLSKLLADRAIGTRSEVDALVRRGRVKVDCTVVKSPKMKLPVDCVIEVNGQEYGRVPLLVAFHKPKGTITTVSDDWDREDLSDVLPKSLLLKHHPVGRLDADSSGLLLLSSDGALTHRLLNPRFEVEREYVATVDVPLAAEEPGDALIKTLHEGVTTADGVYRADVPGIDGRDVRVVVREGKNRMVRRSTQTLVLFRLFCLSWLCFLWELISCLFFVYPKYVERMLANAGYPVLELRRERYGDILLGDLPEGDHAPVSGEALKWAQSVYQ
ncbi:unnamed protein product, partial [Pylaiella littoralis]